MEKRSRSTLTGTAAHGRPRVLDGLFQDVRFALRSFRRSPLFTIAALLSLAAGIGVNVVVFSFVYGYFIHPLPFPDAGRLAAVSTSAPELGIARYHVTWNEYRTLKEANQSFTGLAADEVTDVTLTGGDEPYRVMALRVSDDYFDVLGVEPLLGRDLVPEDARPTDQAALVMTHGLWQRAFGGDPGIIGQTVYLSGEAHTVVGVVPTSAMLSGSGELFIPFREDRLAEIVTGRLRLLGRLAPGVSVVQARQDLERLYAGLAEDFPDESRGKVPVVNSLRTDRMHEKGSQALILYAAVSLVLLLACANVASLLLARGNLRGRELAVRRSLGADRGRLLRQLLTESLLLALAGGALGFLLGQWGRDLMVAELAAGYTRTFTFATDPLMTLSVLGLVVVCGVLFGIVPSLLAVREDPSPILRGAGSGFGGERMRTRFQSLLSGTEVALAVMVVITAGLALKSYHHIRTMDRGFDPVDVVHMEIRLEGPAYRDRGRVIGFFQEVIAEVKKHPQVVDVGAGNPLPYIGWYQAYEVEGVEAGSEQVPVRAVDAVITPDFFRALRMPLLAGRDFGEEDGRPGAVPTAVVSESFARRNWPGEDPLGRRLRYVPSEGEAPAWMTVVGVVGDTRAGTFLPETGWVFLPHAQIPASEMILAIRTRGDHAGVMDHVKRLVWAREPGLALNWNGILEETVRNRYRDPPLFAGLFSVLSLISLVLAMVGVYGVVAGAVTRRSREFGVRLSVGAHPGGLVRMVVGQTTRTALVGLGIGTLATLGVMRLAAGILYGVRPDDLSVYLLAVALMVLVTLISALVPALRIIRVDPVKTLRVD
jgi:putative ABC transport system permease protein